MLTPASAAAASAGPARRLPRRRRDGSGRQLHAELGGYLIYLPPRFVELPLIALTSAAPTPTEPAMSPISCALLWTRAMFEAEMITTTKQHAATIKFRDSFRRSFAIVLARLTQFIWSYPKKHPYGSRSTSATSCSSFLLDGSAS